MGEKRGAIELANGFFAEPRGRDGFYDIFTVRFPLGVPTITWAGKLHEDAIKAWTAGPSPSPLAAEGKSEGEP